MWNVVLKSSICMLILNVGIVISCSIILVFYVWFSLFRVLSGCCLVVMYLGCGMSFEVMCLCVCSGCSFRDSSYNICIFTPITASVQVSSFPFIFKVLQDFFYVCAFCHTAFFVVNRHTASAPSTSGTHTGGVQ